MRKQGGCDKNCMARRIVDLPEAATASLAFSAAVSPGDNHTACNRHRTNIRSQSTCRREVVVLESRREPRRRPLSLRLAVVLGQSAANPEMIIADGVHSGKSGWTGVGEGRARGLAPPAPPAGIAAAAAAKLNAAWASPLWSTASGITTPIHYQWQRLLRRSRSSSAKSSSSKDSSGGMRTGSRRGSKTRSRSGRSTFGSRCSRTQRRSRSD